MKLKKLPLAAFAFCGFFNAVNPVFAQNWIGTSAPGKGWVSVACSADGTKLVAVPDGDFIYTSTNSGATWTAAITAPNANWQAVASSTNGSKLVAVVYSGLIYTSTNSGATWTAATAPSTNWQAVASSADGNN